MTRWTRTRYFILGRTRDRVPPSDGCSCRFQAMRGNERRHRPLATSMPVHVKMISATPSPFGHSSRMLRFVGNMNKAKMEQGDAAPSSRVSMDLSRSAKCPYRVQIRLARRRLVIENSAGDRKYQ